MLSSISLASPVRFAPPAQARLQPQALGVTPRPVGFGNASFTVQDTLKFFVDNLTEYQSVFTALVQKVKQMDPTLQIPQQARGLVYEHNVLVDGHIPEYEANTLHTHNLVDHRFIPTSTVRTVVKQFLSDYKPEA
jgi:hypothetical protein